MNLVLGTAALGFPYGVANRAGKLSQNQVTEIVKKAWECGIREFDTAQMYGDSEKFLGQAFRDLGIAEEVRVITKIDPEIDPYTYKMIHSIHQSLSKLKIRKLYGVLLHREHWLDRWDEGVGENLLNLIKLNCTEKVGISVYQPRYALRAVKTEGIDIIQLPSNILDRRFERAGVFDLAREKGKEIYIRNVLLQGLLLMNSKDSPVRIVKPELIKVAMLAKDLKLTRRDLAISYLRAIAPEANLIFGAETPEQIEENVKSYHKLYSDPVNKWSDFFSYLAGTGILVFKVRETFSNVDEKILIPKMWKGV